MLVSLLWPLLATLIVTKSNGQFLLLCFSPCREDRNSAQVSWKILLPVARSSMPGPPLCWLPTVWCLAAWKVRIPGIPVPDLWSRPAHPSLEPVSTQLLSLCLPDLFSHLPYWRSRLAFLSQAGGNLGWAHLTYPPEWLSVPPGAPSPPPVISDRFAAPPAASL